MIGLLEKIMLLLDLYPAKAGRARCARAPVVSGKLSEAAHALNNATAILHASTMQAQQGADELNDLVKSMQGKRKCSTT